MTSFIKPVNGVYQTLVYSLAARERNAQTSGSENPDEQTEGTSNQTGGPPGLPPQKKSDLDQISFVSAGHPVEINLLPEGLVVPGGQGLAPVAFVDLNMMRKCKRDVPLQSIH